MMRCWLLTLLIVVTAILTGPGAVFADPPTRPLPLTPAQFDYIRHLEAQPQHAAVLDMHATYKSERERSLALTRLSDDVWTVAWSGGFPAAILAVLIAAAPL